MRRFGITLPETLIAAAAVGALLFITALGLGWMRTELKTRQARELLAALNAALSAYHEATGDWPSVAPPAAPHSLPPATWPAGPDQARPTPDTLAAADQVIEALMAVPASREIIERIPQVLRQPPVDRGTAKIDTGFWLHDPWGNRLRCLTANSSREVDRQAVAANAGKPIFASAGPDGEFGLDNFAAAADNIMLMPARDERR